jgi:vacuolar-type H+-ATPase subunit I/STV1
MVRRASIAACLVAFFATVAATPAHTAEPAAEPTPAVVNGAHEAVAWIRVIRPADSEEGRDERYETTRQTLIQRLESPLILLSALRQPEIANLETVRNEEADPMAWLVAALDVTAPKKTDLIRVGLRGERADDLQQIVDTVAQAFVTDVVESEKLIRLGRRDQLLKKLKELQDEIGAKQEARQALEKEAAARKPADLATLGKRLDEIKQEFGQIKRISNALVELLASTELDLKKPPTVQRVEAPTNPEKP